MTLSARTDHTGLRDRNHIRSAALLFAACALTAVSACSSGDSSTSKAPKETPTPAARQSSKPADPTDTAKNEAIDTYKQYWHEMQRSYAQASTDGTDLSKYAAGVALVRVEQDTKDLKKASQVFTGNVTVGSPTVTRLDTDRKVPNATISSCLDVSNWDLLDQKTKKKAVMPTDRLTKYVNISTIERWPDGWKVIKDEPQAGKPC
ncbi:hypothetical protein [Streptomyces sp. NBC_01320]|uniref:hypothetical protein n=1 Tax=Streptomyces sp. NBC_01320 TaxID=2903824 RepID=UPI002E0E71EF|nr:hypothetical protein OG395_55965 [Streptomyces sp. NBC_01320]